MALEPGKCLEIFLILKQPEQELINSTVDEYHRAIEAGTMTLEEATENMEALWLATCEVTLEERRNG